MTSSLPTFSPRKSAGLISADPAAVEPARESADLRGAKDWIADQSHITRGAVRGDVGDRAELLSGYYLGDKFLGNFFDADKAAEAVHWNNNKASGNYMEGLAQSYYDKRGGGETFSNQYGAQPDSQREYIPGSRPIFDDSGKLLGYQVADATMLNTTTSRRQNNESRKYLNLDWMKDNITSAGADKWGNATFFISADKAKDDRFGWEWSHYRGEQQGGMNPLGLVAAIGLTAFGVPALATAWGTAATATTAAAATFGSTLAAGAVIGAGSSLLTGGDPLRGALTGGLTAGVGFGVGDALKGTALSAATKYAIVGAASGATSSLVNGGSFGDVLLGAASGGAGGYVNNVVGAWAAAQGLNNVVAGGLRGAATGATMSAVAGHDIGNGAMIGGVSGAVGGMFDDPVDQSGAAKFTKGLINTAVNSVPNVPAIRPAGTKPSTEKAATPTAVPSFGSLTPNNLKFTQPTRNMGWANRNLAGG